jgi:hypothetical protein
MILRVTEAKLHIPQLLSQRFDFLVLLLLALGQERL